MDLFPFLQSIIYNPYKVDVPESKQPKGAEQTEGAYPVYTSDNRAITPSSHKDFLIKTILESKQWTLQHLDNPELGPEIIDKLAETHPVIQAVLFTYASLANTKMTITARNGATGNLSKELTNLARVEFRKLTRPSRTLASGGSAHRKSETEFLTAIRTMFLTRGSSVLNVRYENKEAEAIFLDPKDLTFCYKDLGNGKVDRSRIIAYQYKTRNGIEKISSGVFLKNYLSSPTNFLSKSPLISTVKPIIILEEFIQQITDCIKLSALPTVLYQLDTAKFMATLSSEDLSSSTRIETAMGRAMKALETVLKVTTNRQTLVIPDTFKPVVINEDAAILKADISKFVNVLKEFVSISMNVSSTALGTGASGVNTASVEMLCSTKAVDYMNKLVAEQVQDILDYVLQIKHGKDVLVEVEFEPMTIRTPLDSEGMKLTKQSRIINNVMSGAISWEQACLELIGDFPNKSTPNLDGLHTVTSKDTVSSQPSAIDRAASPTGTEAKSKGG